MSDEHRNQNESDLDEIWEHSSNSDTSPKPEEPLGEVEQLTAAHVNVRRYTRQIKEVNLQTKYSTQSDQQNLAAKLKQLRTLLVEINQKFLHSQKTRFEAKRAAIKKTLSENFNAQVERLDELQGRRLGRIDWQMSTRKSCSS